MNDPSYFERLIASVERVARHSYYPGIDLTINHVLDDVEDLRSSGQISADQREALRFVLLGMSLKVPTAA